MFSLLLLPETFDILTAALLTTDVLNVFFVQIYLLEFNTYRLQFNFSRQSSHDRRSFRLFRTCFCLLGSSLYFTVRDWCSSSHSSLQHLLLSSPCSYCNSSDVTVLHVFSKGSPSRPQATFPPVIT